MAGGLVCVLRHSVGGVVRIGVRAAVRHWVVTSTEEDGLTQWNNGMHETPTGQTPEGESEHGRYSVLMCVNMAARYTRLLPNALASVVGAHRTRSTHGKKTENRYQRICHTWMLDHLPAVSSAGALPTFVCLPGNRATELPASLPRFATTNEEWDNLARIPRITGVAGSQEQETRGAACSTRCRMRMATGGEQW